MDESVDFSALPMACRYVNMLTNEHKSLLLV